MSKFVFVRGLVFTMVCLFSLNVQAEENLIPAQKQPLHLLSREDQATLERGEISTGVTLIGGVVGTWIGFGLGHAVQGTFNERGAIKFTVGEGVSFGLMVIGLASCTDYSSYDSRNCGAGISIAVAGLLGYVGFRVWEIIDVWTAPAAHNSRYRYLKRSTEAQSKVSFYAIPTPKGEILSGIQFRF